ncbi:MAG: aspartate/glutamate racemase family protein, partial [Candidatus Hydrogenedentota bacterium]
LEETARAIAEEWPAARTGLLATTGTVRSGLYERALSVHGIEVVTPLQLPDGELVQRDCVMGAIYGPWEAGAHKGGGIKSRGGTPGTARLLDEAAGLLVKLLGATVIIAGCTEIPLAFTGETVAGAPLVDPAWVLARASIRRAYGIP